MKGERVGVSSYKAVLGMTVEQIPCMRMEECLHLHLPGMYLSVLA